MTWIRSAVSSIPAENRGQILFGTGRDSGNNCQPTGAKTTFSSGETIYIGGYFTKPIPAGSTGSVAIYVNGVIAGSAPLGDASKAVICYYEVDPLVGAQPGTYRINVSLAGESIADGQVVVQ